MSSIKFLRKLKLCYNRKQYVDDQYIIDNQGHSTKDTKNFYENPKGSILPLGGISSHKGFGLALAIDLLSGGLSGGGCSNSKYSHHGNAAFFLVIKVDPFINKNEFINNFIDLREHIKDSRLADGFDKIYLPGEIERK